MNNQSFDPKSGQPGEQPAVPRTVLLRITISPGPRTNPRGTRSSALAVLSNAVSAYAELLVPLPGAQPWWSPHAWEHDTRSSKRWAQASAVVIDIDHLDPAGKHTPPAAELAAGLAEADLPGSIFFPTPRGARLLFVLDCAQTDRDAYTKAVNGAAVLVSDALERLGFLAQKGEAGYVVDRAATDLARIFFFKGLEHQFRVVCAEPLSAQDLARHAQEPVAPAPRARPALAYERFAAAREQWLLDHPVDFGAPGSGPCPAHPDQGEACFGRTGDGRPGLWTCFSAHHPVECGQPGASGGSFFGSALDLEAFRRRCTPTEVLKADGYLVPPARAPDAAR